MVFVDYIRSHVARENWFSTFAAEILTTATLLALFMRSDGKPFDLGLLRVQVRAQATLVAWRKIG